MEHKGELHKKLTLNWHFTNSCNMSCRYCFVPVVPSLHTDEYLPVLDAICTSGIFDRINFVGGEPTTSPLLLPLLRKAREYGLSTSIVTNGYRLIHDPSYCQQVLSQLDILGLSIDSLSDGTNAAIGRTVITNGIASTISETEYLSLCRQVKDAGVTLKINTVVSSLNVHEDFTSFYAAVKPDRIKQFQVLHPNVCTKQQYDDLLITSAEFETFRLRHALTGARIVAENNDDMTEAYYILGSDGRFLDNRTGIRSGCLLDTPVTDALASIHVDETKYEKRYA